MKTQKRTLQHTLVLVTIATGLFAGGCELIVDFDRTKIPVETIEAGPALDASSLDDASTDPDTGTTDSGTDAAETSTAQDAGDAGDGGDAQP
jgi:hypothetical protein